MVKVSQFGEVTRFELARTIAGRGRYWTVAYHLADTLIDTGCAHTAPELIRVLEGLDVSQVANTHSHEDHIGGNGAVQGTRGAAVLAHALALPVLADPRGRQPETFYRRLFWGYPEPSCGRAVSDGDVIQAGRFRLRVVATPGHSPDHVCFFEEDRGWLFSGDLYVGGLDRAIRVGCDVLGVIAALDRVASLPVRVLFPGAARVPAGDPVAALREKAAYLRGRRDAVLAMRREGHSIGAIARAVFGGPTPIELLTWGDFTRRALVRSCLGEWAGGGG